MRPYARAPGACPRRRVKRCGHLIRLKKVGVWLVPSTSTTRRGARRENRNSEKKEDTAGSLPAGRKYSRAASGRKQCASSEELNAWWSPSWWLVGCGFGGCVARPTLPFIQAGLSLKARGKAESVRPVNEIRRAAGFASGAGSRFRGGWRPWCAAAFSRCPRAARSCKA